MIEKSCDYCEKVIEASTEATVDYLMLQHKISKHRDKLKIEEVHKDG